MHLPSKCHPKNLFGEDASILVNRLMDANSWPKTQNGKNIYCPSTFKFSIQQHKKWEVGHVLVTQILPPTNVHALGYERIYYIILGPIENRNQYEITIGTFLTCSCIDFVSMLTSSLSGRGKWVHCKHLYYILQIVMLWANGNVHTSFNLELGRSS